MGVLLFVDAAVKSTGLLAVGFLAAVCLRRNSAAVRHLVWVCVLGGVMVLPVLEVVLPGWRVLPKWMGEEAKVEVLPKVAPVAVEGGGREVPVVRAGSGESREMAVPGENVGVAGEPEKAGIAQMPSVLPPAPRVVEKAAKREAAFDWVVVAVWVWGSGVVLMLIPMMMGFGVLRGRRRNGQAVTGAGWMELLAMVRGLLGVRRRVGLVRSGECGVPMTFGILRPTVMVPGDAEGWDPEKRRMVLLHEMAHVKRLDCLAIVLGQVVRAMYWFHPLVWVAAARVRAECERACDDVVLRGGMKQSAYAKALLEYAAVEGGGVPAGALAMARKSTLEGRLVEIMDGTRNRRRMTWATVMGVAGLIVVAVVLVACLRERSSPEAPTTQQVAQQARVRELIYTLRNSVVFARTEETYATVRELALIGKPAVPQLCAELEWLDDKHDGALRTIAFTLRVIGDQRAVGALIHALPKTEVMASDCGDTVRDRDVWQFVNDHPLASREGGEKYPEIMIPRADREIIHALQTLTHHQVSEAYNYSPKTSSPENIKAAKEKRQRDVELWEQWWREHQKEFLTAAEIASVENLQKGDDLVGAAGTARSGPLFPTGPQARLGAVHEVLLEPQGAWDNKAFIDFDTNKTYALMEGAKTRYARGDSYAEWLRTFGIDACEVSYIKNEEEAEKDPGKTEYLHGLNSLELLAWPIEHQRWDSIDADIKTGKPLDLGKHGASSNLLSRDPETGEFTPQAYPGTFLFMTHEGGRGILQIMASSDSPAGVKLRYRMFEGSPKNPVAVQEAPAPAEWAKASFAPEVKLTMASPESKDFCALDLDTGDKRVAEAGLLRPEPERPHGFSAESPDWLAKWGGDVIVQPQAPGEELFALRATDMAVCALSGAAWGKLTAAEVLAIVARKAPEKEGFMMITSSPTVPAAWAFQTREGTVGILQIVGGSRNPQTIAFKYKLVAGVAHVPATRKAGKAVGNYDGFAVVRMDRVGEGLESRTMMVGRIEGGSAKVREVPIAKEVQRWELVGARGGKMYMRMAGDVSTFDLESGKVVAYTGGWNGLSQAGLSFGPDVRDGKRLGWGAVQDRLAFDLVVWDPQVGGKTVWRGVDYMEPPTNIASPRPPVVWLDDGHVLTVRVKGNDEIVVVDITTGKVQDIGEIPGIGMIRLIAPQGDDGDALVITDSGTTAVADYAVNVKAVLEGKGKLEKRAALWGAFTVEGKMDIYGPDAVRVKKLSYRGKELGKDVVVAVSPDGRRALWQVRPKGDGDGWILYLFEVGDKEAREVLRGDALGMPVWFETGRRAGG